MLSSLLEQLDHLSSHTQQVSDGDQLGAATHILDFSISRSDPSWISSVHNPLQTPLSRGVIPRGSVLFTTHYRLLYLAE
ncbi:hypothetical protein RRG08_059462 [Elysia crispata]|uniref:Uncharacterized protein n=1 Tax=Elysia crispata TaxID=231223 RepID=A0AAE1A3V8_9GAST|nr:hypothetical protein RRG08_059462 [Elysia crispata]